MEKDTDTGLDQSLWRHKPPDISQQVFAIDHQPLLFHSPLSSSSLLILMGEEVVRIMGYEFKLLLPALGLRTDGLTFLILPFLTSDMSLITAGLG